MSVLKPEIVRIGARRYRKNPFTLSFQDDADRYANAPYQEETLDMYADEDDDDKVNAVNIEYNDEACLMDASSATTTTTTAATCKKTDNSEAVSSSATFSVVGIEFNSRKKLFECRMRLNSDYFGYIIGRGGERKAKLERETSAQILLPSKNNNNTDQFLRIEASSQQSVAACRHRVLSLLDEVRHSRSFTHMLTFPLKHSELRARFEAFRTGVMASGECSQARGVNANLFVDSNKLHLTICIITLISDLDMDKAVDLLNKSRETFIRELLDPKQPLRINIKGLEIMNDDPSEVDVLYAKIMPVENDSSLARIQRMADKLLNSFVESGLSKRQHDRVKLHATLMKSQEKEASSQQQLQQRQQAGRNRESFDARNIFKLFGDFDFGQFTLPEIHLNIRHTTNPVDRYYQHVTSITL